MGEMRVPSVPPLPPRIASVLISPYRRQEYQTYTHVQSTIRNTPQLQGRHTAAIRTFIAEA